MDVRELTYDYTDDSTDGNNVGFFEFDVDRDMVPPIWVYYQLEGFFQNHRRHSKNYAPGQFSAGTGGNGAADADLQRCEPTAYQGDGGRPIYPCGVLALTLFNDSFVLVQSSVSEGSGQTESNRIHIQSGADAIAWPADREGAFHNLDPEGKHSTTGLTNEVALDMWILERFPPVACEQQIFSGNRPYVPVNVAMRQKYANDASSEANKVTVIDCTGYNGNAPTCNFTRLGAPFVCEGGYKEIIRKDWGVESGHLAVWMRLAGLPNFRKLWGRVDTPIKAGNKLKVFFVDKFPAKRLFGRKVFILSTVSTLGGRGDLLGHCFIGIGLICLVFGAWLFYQRTFHPRVLGDVSLLFTSRA